MSNITAGIGRGQLLHLEEHKALKKKIYQQYKAAFADIPELCRAFTSQGRPVYGTLLDGEDIYASNLEGQALVVMGNESNGISGAVRNEISRGLRIPSFGKSGAESLNVAVATAVTLSEFRRRQLV